MKFKTKEKYYIEGWILSNNEQDDMVIQKYDESDRFKSDNEATEFVVKNYHKLLKERNKLKKEKTEILKVLQLALIATSTPFTDKDHLTVWKTRILIEEILNKYKNRR